MHTSIGSVVRKIRSDKAYSQQYVVDGVMTQSAYSKFELNKTDITFSSLSRILENLEVSFEEFLYIQNEFKHSEKDAIVKKFLSISYNNEEKVKELLTMAVSYLKKKDDHLISDIKSLAEALLILIHTADKEMLLTSVSNVWKRLSVKNQFYFSDLYVLNAIFYFFPLDTMIEIKKLAFKSIDRYGEFQDIQRLKINFCVNISLMLIKEACYEEALKEIETAIIYSEKQKAYLQRAVCYVRKGICLSRLGEDGLPWLQKGLEILTVLEEQELLQMAKTEIELYAGY
ncbi:helix-turn-helix domain-containing protein [Sporosarcina gallistercoris]|uniref:Helix-turn-helix transcriptional regulator n=1 Tax=Sporosarcina gallistercoris TaxID=2762245 RepID=A0ABR8PM41_9BACL|nr:helix-turn-helix transcriptional regulator [Sporosarcina gallistercoris]MBD7909238.1 helix-turn-helix transcriptional regulator [Sporosarcina gallistercoris]